MLQVAGTRVTQEDGSLTDDDDLPNLLFTCQRAIIDGPASTSRGARVAVSEGSPGGETRTLVLGREVREGRPPGPLPERGIKESVGRSS